jgi:hypothetical protein
MPYIDIFKGVLSRVITSLNLPPQADPFLSFQIVVGVIFIDFKVGPGASLWARRSAFFAIICEVKTK